MAQLKIGDEVCLKFYGEQERFVINGKERGSDGRIIYRIANKDNYILGHVSPEDILSIHKWTLKGKEAQVRLISEKLKWHRNSVKTYMCSHKIDIDKLISILFDETKSIGQIRDDLYAYLSTCRFGGYEEIKFDAMDNLWNRYVDCYIYGLECPVDVNDYEEEEDELILY